MDVLIQENLIGSRFKSEDSIYRKYNKTLKAGGGFKQCFNDILGFRLHFDMYPSEYPEYFRVVDLRDGKQIDDGYSAIHLYYLFNIWSHRWAYKYEEPRIGKMLYELYKQGKLKTEKEFINKLDESRGGKVD